LRKSPRKSKKKSFTGQRVNRNYVKDAPKSPKDLKYHKSKLMDNYKRGMLIEKSKKYVGSKMNKSKK